MKKEYMYLLKNEFFLFIPSVLLHFCNHKYFLNFYKMLVRMP